MRPPQTLNRRGLKQHFPRVREATWDNLFDYEKHNGLYACRVQGPDKHAHYDVEKVMEWLRNRSLYRTKDFYDVGEILYSRPQLQVRTHALAG